MMYQAKRGGAPLVVIAGESGVRYDSMDAQMAADLVAMARPVTKWSTRVDRPVARRCASCGGRSRSPRRRRPGRSSSRCRWTCSTRRADGGGRADEHSRTRASRPAPRRSRARRPTARGRRRSRSSIIGDGVAFSGAQAELTRVAELLGAAVWGANCSEVNIDADHPLFRGQLGHMFGDHSKAITSQADAVLIVRHVRLPRGVPGARGRLRARTRKVVHVDLDAYEIAKNFPVDLGLVADPKLDARPARRGARADAQRRAARRGASGA